jgi:chromosome partitioning protein
VSVPVIAFFNNRAGVGKTSLVYHVAHMFSDLGMTVLAADLDPQANLTALSLDEAGQHTLWGEDSREGTLYKYAKPAIHGTGDVEKPAPLGIGEGFWLLPGDILLSGFEDELTAAWRDALNGNERPFRVLSAFCRVLEEGAAECRASAVLLDLGPNLGSINRAALIGADFVVVPLTPDLRSLRGLRDLGPALNRWRDEWRDRLEARPVVELPLGQLEPLGYIVRQHSVRFDRSVNSSEACINQVPSDYRKYVLNESGNTDTSVLDDPHNIALLRHYRSLMPMARESRKPMFHLKPADGALGAHLQSVHDAYHDFKSLAEKIARRAHLDLSQK